MSRGLGLTIFAVLALAVYLPLSLMVRDLLSSKLPGTALSLLMIALFALFASAYNLVWWKLTGMGLVRWPSSASPSEPPPRP